jgi:hypothetical protein
VEGKVFYHLFWETLKTKEAAKVEFILIKPSPGFHKG